MAVINCPNCGKAVSEEFGKCPYCNEEFNQSNTTNKVVTAENENDNQNGKKLSIKLNKKVIYLGFIVLIAITLFAGISLLSTRNLMNNLEERVASLESDNSDYREENDDLKEKYDRLNEELEKSKSSINSLRKTNTDLTNELDKYKDQQKTIDSLNEKIASLEEEKQSYKDYVQVLEAQLAQNAQQVYNASSSSSANNNSTTPIGAMVWISATGEKYHNKPNCGRMNPNTARQISRSDAEARGYSACKNCF